MLQRGPQKDVDRIFNLDQVRASAFKQSQKLRAEKEVRKENEYSFIYPVAQIVVPAGETVLRALDIGADADFEMFGWNISYTVPVGEINHTTLLQEDTNNGKRLISVPVPLELISTPGQQQEGVDAINGQRFSYYQFNYFMDRQTSMNLTFTNTGTFETIVNMAYVGKKWVVNPKERLS